MTEFEIAFSEVVVRIFGELDIATAPIMEETLEPVLLRPAARIVLDLQHLSFLDAVGVGVLVRLRGRLTGRSELVLRALQPLPRRVLEITDLYGGFRVEP